jgi:S1-C subfamily serine protease
MKKLSLWAAFVILAATVVSTASLPAASQKDSKPKAKPPTSRPDLIANMKSAVIQISYQSDPPVPNGTGIAGTGFLVSNDGYALTAAHVVNEVKKLLQANGARGFRLIAGVTLDTSSGSFHGSFEQIDCTVVDMDVPHDIAILKLSRNPFGPFFNSGIVVGGKPLTLHVQTAKLQAQRPAEGTELLVSGYPLSVPTLVTQRGTVASLSFTEVEIERPGAPPWFKFPEVADQILADIVVNPGNSGGPFYLSDTGEVIGICHGNLLSPVHLENGAIVQMQEGGTTHILEQNSGLAVVLPIKYAIALLDKNKITYEH